jgi:type II secretory pathway component GspD/PulD (secretin)
VDWVVLPLTLVLTAQARPAPTPAQMPALPMTQLDDRAIAADLDTRTFSMTFGQPVPISEVLLRLVRGTGLSVVPDPAIAGTFIGDLKNVTMRQALGLILEPFGLAFSVDGGIIRVFKREPETRLYDISYLAAERAGAAVVGTDPGRSTGSARVTTTTRTDVFADIAKGIPTILSAQGTFNVDRRAGLVQVADFRERLDRVGVYLDAVQDRVQRQVQIEATILEVELNDDTATSLDWTALRQTRDPARVMAALVGQGKVTVLATPRLSVMNNEPAIVKTEALSLSVTPQISADAIITLSLSPMLFAPQAIASDMVARVADGETIVVSGMGRDREMRERRGRRDLVVTRKHIELVVLLTPRILPLP